jgi:NAD(P)-dependent dehydrogenase (short-subunit alcohol dehydrogenase family)
MKSLENKVAIITGAGAGLGKAIAPGDMNTSMGATIDLHHLSPLVTEQILPGMALNPRAADPLGLARTSLFLASDDTSLINGAVLVADGPFTDDSMCQPLPLQNGRN